MFTCGVLGSGGNSRMFQERHGGLQGNSGVAFCKLVLLCEAGPCVRPGLEVGRAGMYWNG